MTNDHDNEREAVAARLYKMAARIVWVLLLPIHIGLYIVYRIGTGAEWLDNIVCKPHYWLWEKWRRKSVGESW